MGFALQLVLLCPVRSLYMLDKDPPVAARASSCCWSFEVYEV